MQSGGRKQSRKVFSAVIAAVQGGPRWLRVPRGTSVCLELEERVVLLGWDAVPRGANVMTAHSYFRALA